MTWFTLVITRISPITVRTGIDACSIGLVQECAWVTRSALCLRWPIARFTGVVVWICRSVCVARETEVTCTAVMLIPAIRADFQAGIISSIKVRAFIT